MSIEMWSAEPGARFHCKRVAALADYAALALDLSADLRATLAEACRMHHLPPKQFSPAAWLRLLRDMGGSSIPDANPEAAAVLRVWSATGEKADRTGHNQQLSAILGAANALDEAFEGLPYEARPAGEVVDDCLANAIPPALAKVFRTLRCAHPRDLANAIHRTPLTTVPSAHASDVAKHAQQIAASHGRDCSVAQQAGLLHDCGSDVWEHFDDIVRASLAYWQQKYFPAVYCERLVTGSDHADWGADLLLRRGGIGENVIDAVRFHHRPELTTSALAATLYLAEEETGSEEDLPSAARLHRAQSLLTTASARPSFS